MQAAMRDRPVLFWQLFVCVTGAAVMAVEFSGERLLAPYFGSSEPVWGGLIGLVLLALAVGYRWGGRLADRRPQAVLLGLIVVAAGAFVGALPEMAQPILETTVRGLLFTPGVVALAALCGTALLLVPPVIALGAVSPFTLRLVVNDQRRTGEIAGSLYAWSTVGSLIGTFVPVFVTIPDVGVRATLWFSSAALILVGAVVAGRARYALLLLVPLVGLVFHPRTLKPVAGLVTEVETPYQFASVYRLPGGDLALSVNDGAGIQSLYTKARLTGMYYDDFLLLPFAIPGTAPVQTLLLGTAAGTIPTLYERDVAPYRKVSLTGVEIDPTLTALGRRYFHLNPKTAVVSADARVYLETAKRRLDLIISDAYSQEIYIPQTLSTQQFFALCRQHLAPSGILALNVNASRPHAPLLAAFERTLGTVFPHVYVARARGSFNYLVMASGRPIRLAAPSELPSFLQATATDLQAGLHSAQPRPGLVLTDDRAPVQALTNGMILRALRRGVAVN